MKLIKENKRIYLISLVLSVALVIIFCRSYYWPTEGYEKRRALEIIIAVIGIVVVPFLAIAIKPIRELLNTISDAVINLKTNWKAFLKGCLIFVVGVIGAVLAYKGYVCIHEGKDNILMFYVMLAVALIASSVVAFRKIIKENPEILFVCVALICGLTIIRVTPPVVGVACDDEIHYARTLSISNVFNNINYISDVMNIDEYVGRVLGHYGYSREERTEYVGKLNTLYEEKFLHESQYRDGGIYSIAYVPGAIGVLFGRGLGLSYEHVFMMGKVFILFTYIIIFALAMRNLKKGKILVALIGLIPTSLFMASSYTYDWWVIAFIVWGYSYLISIYQDFDEENLVKKYLKGVVCVTIGCIPKAVYFPLLLPFLFIPWKLIKDKKRVMLLIGILLLCGFFLLGSMTIPKLMAGEDYVGDLRGGEDVNGALQMQYIINNPFSYSKILLGFLVKYISIDNMGWLTNLAYVGDGKYWGLLVVTLVAVAFLEQGESNVKMKTMKITTLVGILGVLILVPTALYISFTPVGHNTVLGCQYRYLLPIFLPFLYCLGTERVENKMNKSLFNTIPMCIFAFVIISALKSLCVDLY